MQLQARVEPILRMIGVDGQRASERFACKCGRTAFATALVCSICSFCVLVREYLKKPSDGLFLWQQGAQISNDVILKNCLFGDIRRLYLCQEVV
jgi:hypothetical protein